MCGANLQQKNIETIYNKYPQTQTTQHRVHASIAVVGQEWKNATSGKRPLDLGRMTVSMINKGCDNTVKRYANWPAVLHLKDLSRYALEQPIGMLWWLSDDSPEGA
jgi:hypothetical protein